MHTGKLCDQPLALKITRLTSLNPKAANEDIQKAFARLQSIHENGPVKGIQCLPYKKISVGIGENVLGNLVYLPRKHPQEEDQQGINVNHPNKVLEAFVERLYEGDYADYVNQLKKLQKGGSALVILNI